uniref:Ig-like domain-containing protein n=1 Tax=Cyprinus carpio TaxID=7962 RepID=A0A8C2CIL5_CYPCA
MADKCDLCLLGLIILSSLLTGTSRAKVTHVFISTGENVHLSCSNAFRDCKSTTWNHNRFSNLTAVELIAGGRKKKDTESHERLSLGSDCSLNISNISKEDYGYYTCQQYVNGELQGNDTHVYLHVLHVSPSSSSSSSSASSQTEISAGRSVTLYCQLYSYDGLSCDDWIRSERVKLFWVNQAGVKLPRLDSRYQILLSSGHCIITLNTTLLNEDDNREWRCEAIQRDQVKTSVTYTVKSSAQADSATAVIPVHNTNSQDPSTANTHKAKDTHSRTLHWLLVRREDSYCVMYNQMSTSDSESSSTTDHQQAQESPRHSSLYLPALATGCSLDQVQDDDVCSQISHRLHTLLLPLTLTSLGLLQEPEISK